MDISSTLKTKPQEKHDPATSQIILELPVSFGTLTPSLVEPSAILTTQLIYLQYNLLIHLSNITMHFHTLHPTVSSMIIIYITAYYSHSPLPQTHLRWNPANQ